MAVKGERDAILLGVIAPLAHGPEQELQKARDFGLPTCQLVCWQPEVFTKEMAERTIAASEQYNVAVTTVWTGYPGPAVWNFIEGPSTIGLVPEVYRAERVEALKRGADFASWIGAPSITTHVGFIPADPGNPVYAGVVAALREVVEYCAALDLDFCFETGQETPVTLLRVIEDLGKEHLGINLDPANLLMYGNANPIDALDVFGEYVVGVHAKDGEYPTNGRELGVEKPLGEGRVGFPRLVAKLKELGYRGALTIEREISGPKQIADIKHAIKVLSALV